jgi:protein-tyrosine kinase
MSSLIEQAAQRLEQLRRAGASLPPSEAKSGERLPGGGQAAVAAVRHSPHDHEPLVSSRRVELDFDALAASGLLVPNAPRSQLGDQFRVIKRPLIRNAIGKGATKLAHGNLIMITSAVAGEGKSFTAVNLALSIANELDHTVMLVDADVARPSVARMLGLPPASDSPGLLDVLENQVEMSGALLRTNIDKLSVLPAGRRHERATELLASASMSRLIEEIARRYPDRIIIFDSPPLLQTTEARALATHVGQVVLVVRAEHTPQAAVQEALAAIEACPVRLLLLNRASVTAGSSYGYGYGYSYGSSAGQSELEAPTA